MNMEQTVSRWLQSESEKGHEHADIREKLACETLTDWDLARAMVAAAKRDARESGRPIITAKQQKAAKRRGAA